MKTATYLSGLIAASLVTAVLATDAKKTDMTATKASFYDFTVKNIDGEDVKLADYRGKVLLVVNVASRCGYTKRNYSELEPLYKRLKGQGFEVLAFPANNFMGQEPGSNEEIKSFCTKQFKVTFPLFEKVSVKGKDMCPLYQFLTTQTGEDIGGDIRWNFEKFLVSRDGRVIGRFSHSTPPSDTRLIAAVEKALAEPVPTGTAGKSG